MADDVISRLKKCRGIVRSSVTKQIKSIETELRNKTLDNLEELIEILKEFAIELESLDNEIHKIIDSKQLEAHKAALTPAKREQMKKGGDVLTPVVNLKSRKDDDEEAQLPILGLGPKENEREKRIRDRERDRDRGDMRDRDRYNRRYRYDRNREFDRSGRELDRPPRGKEYEEERSRRVSGTMCSTIAPLLSLMESNEKKEPAAIPTTPFTSRSSVAARIMAMYGFKEGQGLGKKQQGMSQALQVEKTSKRGGKIIHEKDLAKIAEVQPPSPPQF
ncbi:uncharacterized protein TNIN_59271 [Trichonephila inaurata madagascariensis]|uniref:G-patch domain-containing protein n=1 Tax=Trichonephila inaurata madagascariensis TaxID=2747483 RepID=A0A8X6YD85_9ARAC|nr:uncharacterized protein TNIN_59271 [Trichonephila inaurata madagascariensis]